jgi:hypothetical protein
MKTAGKLFEETALQAIKILLNHNKVYNWAYLSIFLTMLQYARDWDRAENAGFWAYISEQFGYNFENTPAMYGVLTNSVKEACRAYSRLFVVDQTATTTTTPPLWLTPSPKQERVCTV